MTDTEAQLINLVSHEEVERVFKGSNFGSGNPRDIIADTLLKVGCDFGTGYTALCICRELNLIGKKTRNLTKKGRRYMYWSYARKVNK